MVELQTGKHTLENSMKNNQTLAVTFKTLKEYLNCSSFIENFCEMSMMGVVAKIFCFLV